MVLWQGFFRKYAKTTQKTTKFTTWRRFIWTTFALTKLFNCLRLLLYVQIQSPNAAKKIRSRRMTGPNFFCGIWRRGRLKRVGLFFFMSGAPQRQQLASKRTPFTSFAPAPSTVSCIPMTRNLSPADPFPLPWPRVATPLRGNSMPHCCASALLQCTF